MMVTLVVVVVMLVVTVNVGHVGVSCGGVVVAKVAFCSDGSNNVDYVNDDDGSTDGDGNSVGSCNK